MSKFILIDHSLCGVGGHHFEYSMHVLREAEAAGYEIVMGTNRQFKEFSQVPNHWCVLPVFQYRTYTKYAVICSLNGKRIGNSATRKHFTISEYSPGSIQSWWKWAREFKRRSRCRQRIRSFANACERMFANIDTKAGDIVMIPTLSELDLSGLVEFMSKRTESKQLTWHLQFHFDFIGGRQQPVETKLGRCAEMARRFKADLSRVADHRIVLHCTTDGLASQYQRLGVGEFKELPYPIDPRFHQPDRDSKNPDCPKITFAGGLRNEKGHSSLASTIRQIKSTVLNSGKAQVQIQAHEHQFRKLVAEIDQRTAGESSSESVRGIVRIDHPLDGDRYVDMIHETDIGVFLYDGNTYASRCSGILAEMLAAGTPVIVPAGCWLADQLAEPNFRYLQQKYDSLANTIRLQSKQNGTTVPVAVPSGASACIVRYRFDAQPEHGAFLKLESAQSNENANVTAQTSNIIGQRKDNADHFAIISLASDTRSIQFAWSNAYHQSDIAIKELDISFVDAEASFPMGAVGLTASSNDEFPALLADLLSNYEHYRESAREYSGEWSRKHLPSNTFHTLMSRSIEAQENVAPKVTPKAA